MMSKKSRQSKEDELFEGRRENSLEKSLKQLSGKAYLALPKPALTHVKRALKLTIRLLHSVGVTSVQDAGANTLLLHGFKELDEERALLLDINAHLVSGVEALSMEPKEDMEDLLMSSQQYKSKHVDTRFVKMILDGVPLPPLFTHCGLDENGNPDESKITMEEGWEKALLKHDDLGKTFKIHCTGSGSTRKALDAIASARERNPNGPRHEIAHCNGVHNGMIPMVKSFASLFNHV
jgi:predicted amidohydrolase YtcJ